VRWYLAGTLAERIVNTSYLSREMWQSCSGDNRPGDGTGESDDWSNPFAGSVVRKEVATTVDLDGRRKVSDYPSSEWIADDSDVAGAD